MIKCNVCGSENEAAALFCGTCGSPLSPADAKAVVDDATKPEIVAPGPDDTVVPGQGVGARRDLGTGAALDRTTAIPTPGPDTSAVEDDVSSGKPTIVCSVCGTVNDATRTYCRKCANELKPAPPPPPPPPPAPVTRKISPVAIGLGAAAVVVALALIGVLAFGGPPAATLPPTARASLPAATILASAAPPSVGPTAPARTFSEGARAGLVAFARCDTAGKNCAIYVINADGKSRSTRITGTSPSAFDPSLSYDRKQVVYSANPGLRIVTVKTKSFVQHSTGQGDSGASWSPNGKLLTFAGFRTRDKDGTDLEIRTDGLASSDASQPLTNNDVPDTEPVFTPDGKSIVYVSGDGTSAELMILDIATKTSRNLTTDQFEDRDPSVSPDGTEVVFSSTRSGSGFDLFVLDVASGAITPLPSVKGDERHPAFSPGGRYIVFSGGTAGAEDLYILDRSTNKIVTLTTGPSSDIWPTWH
ncbi:MAG TPA: zinc ribbon domain-containing protein [Candidatus Limnocylindrales bacterium]